MAGKQIRYTQKAVLRMACFVTVQVHGPDVSLEVKVSKRTAREFLKYPDQYTFAYWPEDRYLNISGYNSHRVTLYHNTYCQGAFDNGKLDPDSFQVFRYQENQEETHGGK